MKIVMANIAEGHPNRPGTKLEAVKAVVIHYTQNDSASATDTANVRYIGRKYVRKEVEGKMKSFESDGVTPFRFGSAHVFCDMDSVTFAIPLDEVAWGCGDKNFHGGYQNVAEKVFKRRQNFQTVSVEICNNDVIKNSDEDWNAAVENARQFVVGYLKQQNLKVDVEGSLNPQELTASPVQGTVLILRHYDISGKNCPAPFVASQESWRQFVNSVAAEV